MRVFLIIGLVITALSLPMLAGVLSVASIDDRNSSVPIQLADEE